jgi:hypothetical protein
MLTTYFNNIVTIRKTTMSPKPTIMFATQYSGTGKTSLGGNLPFILRRNLDKAARRKVVEKLERAVSASGQPMLTSECVSMLRAAEFDFSQPLLCAYFAAAYKSELGWFGGATDYHTAIQH